MIARAAPPPLVDKATPATLATTGRQTTGRHQSPVVDDRDLLAAEIAWLRSRLHPDDEAVPQPRPARSHRLDDVTQRFGLSSFERDVLLLAAAVELDGATAAIVADLGGTADPRPTFGMALAVLPDGHWDALAPSGPLRRWRLLELHSGPTIATGRLGVDEVFLHHLVGLAVTDPRLAGITAHPDPQSTLSPSQQQRVDEVASMVGAAGDRVLVHVGGDDHAATWAATTRLARQLRAPDDCHGDVSLMVMAEALPPPGHDLANLALLVDRQALLVCALPVVAAPDHATARVDPARVAATWLVSHLTSPIVVAVGRVEIPAGRIPVRLTLSRPSPAEQRRLWHQELRATAHQPVADEVLATADELAHHHRLSGGEIRGLARQWLATATVSDGVDPKGQQRLRDLTREWTRVGMDGLAQRLVARATWDDIVLPDGHLHVLRDLVRQVRHRVTVHQDWGFERRVNGGLGITALFSGESGTGKTLAAQVVANDLGLDLFRVDLAATVDKYIGETEKNLGRIFDAAEASGAVLLFDEADALFGKRGEVRDGHDRYANLEVAYLLQRMEAYRGLAILTTNLRANLDRAFLRRLRFVVQFPFPDHGIRAEIWRRVFPPETPVDPRVDPQRLAKLALTGGSIWSIALSAAFVAAEDDTPVTPAHLLQAARVDAAKHDRILTDSEVVALS